MKTKCLSVCICSILFTLIVSISQGAEPSPIEKNKGGAVKLALQREVFIIGEQIIASLTTTNTADNPITVIEIDPELDFRFEVHGSDGKIMPLTDYGEHIRERLNMLRLFPKAIAPGESIRCTVEISKMIRLENPGKYTLTAWRKISANGGKQFQESKSISVPFELQAKP